MNVLRGNSYMKKVVIVDSSVGKLDSKGRNESDGGKVAANGVFVMVDVGFEDENEKSAEEIKDGMFNSSKDESNRPLNNDIMLKDIEEWRASKSEISLALGSVNVANALDVGGGTKEKVSEIGTLKEEVKDGDLNGNGEENAFEESENVEDQSCEEHYMVSKIYRSNDMSTIVNEGKLFVFDPGGYKRNVTCVVSRLKEINRSTEVGPDGVAIVISVCSVADIREDMGAEAKKWREGFESKKGVEGVSAEHGSGRKITNDCSHFSTQIGDLKSIKKILENVDVLEGESTITENGHLLSKSKLSSILPALRDVTQTVVCSVVIMNDNLLSSGVLEKKLKEAEAHKSELKLILGPLLDKNLEFCLRTSVPNLGEEMTVVALKACQHLVATFRRCMDTTKPGDNVCYTSLMAAGYRYKFDAMWEKENESICDDDKFVALLLSDKIDADRKHYDENLQLMVQMMLGASNLSTQWDNTMQLKSSGLTAGLAADASVRSSALSTGFTLKLSFKDLKTRRDQRLCRLKAISFSKERIKSETSYTSATLKSSQLGNIDDKEEALAAATNELERHPSIGTHLSDEMLLCSRI
ncbi:hypothetical protein POM88_047440 [Heracleum sosnowskyi]|uniref:Uncharacterized protein n=1 Tax=Heracleum sosnowskyi TaxID=360622 RepID=A0AAD8LZL1_9APIA|nr:hypothetical protein POM88_047440 [Heracleum sosnowskyi]